MGNLTTSGKMKRGIVTIVILAVCLCLTTFALFYTSITVRDNLFSTGKVEINLNDGNPVINEHDFIFEPGMTVKRDFFLESKSSCDTYYKLYFADICGNLSDFLSVTVSDGDKLLYNTVVSDFTNENTAAADGILKAGERKNLTVTFYLPEKVGNSAQNTELSFTMCAKAT